MKPTASKLGPLTSKDRLGALLLLAFCSAYGLLSQDIVLLPGNQNTAFHARTMPTFLTALGITLSLLLLLFPTTHAAHGLRGINWLKLVLFMLLMSLFGLAIRPLGFILATTTFLLISFALLAERSYLRLLVIPLAVAVGFWAIMELLLGVYLHPLPAFMSGIN